MLDMQLGLTKTYNLFHDPGIEHGAKDLPALAAQLKKSGARIGAPMASARIRTLRDLHVHMDQAVLAAYGRTDIALGHGFHEVDFLPENDRVRFTISPAARCVVLKRLLDLNHRRHAEEIAEGREEGKNPKRKGRKPAAPGKPEQGC
jgi:hypothetical protein